MGWTKKKKYQVAKNEKEALAKVNECAGEIGKLNLLLRRTAYHNDLLTAKCALENGADPNSQNLFGESAWSTACEKGSVEMVRLFLKHGASLGQDKFGTPPLFYAINNSREDIVRELIKAGADVNGRENSVLKTPLHRAATGHRTFKIVLALLEAGADPRAVNCGGEDVLTSARSFDRTIKRVDKKHTDTDPKIIKALQQALKKWKGKPLPKKPRRKPKSELQKLAQKDYLLRKGYPSD